MNPSPSLSIPPLPSVSPPFDSLSSNEKRSQLPVILPPLPPHHLRGAGETFESPDQQKDARRKRQSLNPKSSAFITSKAGKMPAVVYDLELQNWCTCMNRYRRKADGIPTASLEARSGVYLGPYSSSTSNLILSRSNSN